jgi:Zn-dependent alcohol dehydrogenase
MRAAVLRQVGLIEIEDIDLPEPGPGELRVKIKGVGVCHTDLVVSDGSVPAPLPIVLGHEGAGIVDALGDGVTDLAIGDHVVISASGGCGICHQCQLGAPGLCETGSIHYLDGKLGYGQRRLSKGAEEINHFCLQSSFAEYAVIQRWSAVRIAEDIPFDVACLAACGVPTGYGAVINRARLMAGESVLVIGAGGVGLAAMLGAVSGGAGRIIVADKSAAAGALARELGATDIVQVGPDTDVAVEVHALTGRGVDIAIDAVGTVSTVPAAFLSLRRGGRAVVVGAFDAFGSVTVPLYGLLDQRVLTGSTGGSVRPQVDIPRILELYRTGRLSLDRLVTRRYGLDDLPRALDEFGVEAGRAVLVL